VGCFADIPPAVEGEIANGALHLDARREAKALVISFADACKAPPILAIFPSLSHGATSMDGAAHPPRRINCDTTNERGQALRSEEASQEAGA
jgi:hypothetical protein